MNLKTRLKLSPVFKPLNALLRVLKRIQWKLTGSQVPPLHEIKQARLVRLQGRFGPRVLIETGTYRGKMIFAMRPYFDRIVSIEVDPALAERAKGLFAGCPDVEVVLGDSGQCMPDILVELGEPALFWLDGHYSGEGTGKGDKRTPILEELDAVFDHAVSGHVIAVDDAHCFNGERDYPTIEALRQYVVDHTAGAYDVEVAENIILITPRG